MDAMTLDSPDNPPAFPRPSSGEGLSWSGAMDGMDLRDYFAGQAIAGLMQAAVEGKVYDSVGTIAQWAYQLADAMLIEREK